MESFYLEYDIVAGGRQFYLAHSALKTPLNKKKSEITPTDKYIWERMDYSKEYFQDKQFVSGHSPTFFIDEKWKGRIYKNHNHIAIDCGVVYGEKLGCVCLNNMNEYYI